MSTPSNTSEVVHQVILSRRTVHNYASGPVAEAALERALEAACAAPNHRMTEPWRFTLVGPECRGKLVDVALRLKAVKGPLSAAAEEQQRHKMLCSDRMLVVSRVRHTRAEVAREDYAAVCCAVQNLMLSLWSEGIGTKWTTGGVTSDSRSYLLLGIDEALEEVVGFVWIGIPEAEAPKPRRRLPLAEVLRRLP